MKDLKEFVETLWSEFKHLADSHFLRDATSHFQERFWEMYLAVSLIRKGFDVSNSGGQGPDFLLTLDTGLNIRIEATAPGPGTGDDAVPELKMGVANRVPDDEIVLRFTGAISAKLKQFEDALGAGVVQSTDSYIVAINGIRVKESISEGTLPFILKAVFPFGNLNVVLDKNTKARTDSYYSHRPSIAKKSGSEVRTDIFASENAKLISAVLYSRCDCANHPEVLGSEYHLVHNPFAINPIPKGSFAFGREYWADGREIGRKNWNDDAA